ncbi:MAG: very short patch repair endonuclease [Nitrososphaerota archaeon]|nr:very short patch repair endonuclease [Nitrososphaerota archaeon]MDG6981633.1 very short patch repair endonuclease [Nitrososphaerota archaeon]
MARPRQVRIPPPTSTAVHNVMAANRGTNTGPEGVLRRSLKSILVGGYRLNHGIAGVRVDLAFPSKRVAVLVNGCFWHHCPACNLPLPKSHTAYWKAKFERNAERDKLNRAELEAAGWSVIVIWEHELEAAPADCARRVKAALGVLRRPGVVRGRVQGRVLEPGEEAA